MEQEGEMMIADPVIWHDVVAIAAVVGSCVASILIFVKDNGGGKRQWHSTWSG